MYAKTISRIFGLLAALLTLVTTKVLAQTTEMPPSVFILNINQVNPGVIKSFEQKYKNTTSLSWYQTKENNVLVKYSQDGQTQYALFTPDGAHIRQFTYGTERNLPTRVKNTFKDKYWNATVVNVAHVKQDFRDMWIIYAEKDDNSFAVKIEDGEVEEM